MSQSRCGQEHHLKDEMGCTEGGKNGKSADTNHQKSWLIAWPFQQVCLESPALGCFTVAEGKKLSPASSWKILWVVTTIKPGIKVGKGGCEEVRRFAGLCISKFIQYYFVGILDFASIRLMFSYKLFGNVLSKEERPYATSLEKTNVPKTPPGLVEHHWMVERRRQQIRLPGWELWFHQ